MRLTVRRIFHVIFDNLFRSFGVSCDFCTFFRFFGSKGIERGTASKLSERRMTWPPQRQRRNIPIRLTNSHLLSRPFTKKPASPCTTYFWNLCCLILNNNVENLTKNGGNRRIDMDKTSCLTAGKEAKVKQSSRKHEFGTAALYCRLSRDDNLDT